MVRGADNWLCIMGFSARNQARMPLGSQAPLAMLVSAGKMR